MTPILRFAVPFCLFLSAATAQADLLVDGGDGFVAALPEPAGAGELGAVGRALRAERADLAKEAEGKMGFGDLLITVVAPGGLLYAAHKKARAEEAAAELVLVDQDLALLEGELRRQAERDGLVAELR